MCSYSPLIQVATLEAAIAFLEQQGEMSYASPAAAIGSAPDKEDDDDSDNDDHKRLRDSRADR